MSHDILTLLNSYNNNTLWEMAKEAKLPNTTGPKLHKNKLLQLMEQEYFKPERIQAAHSSLTEKEKQIINRLLLHQSSIATRLFKRELLRAELAIEPEGKANLRRWPYGRSTANPRNPKSTAFEDIIARLTLHGLVFSHADPINIVGLSYKLQYDPGDFLIIPPVVRQHLPPPQPLITNKAEWQPTSIKYGDPQFFLRDLYLYWDTVRRNPIALLQAGHVGKRSLKVLNEALLTPDPTLDTARQEDQTSHLYLLRQLLQELRLIRPLNDKLQIIQNNKDAIPSFWKKTTADQVQQYIQAWRNIPHPFTSKKEAKYVTQNRNACHVLLKLLEELPPATWIEIDDLFFRLQNHNEEFLFAGRSSLTSGRGYYYHYGYYGEPQKILKEMDELETNFISEVMAGFLFQSGLVELGYRQETDPIEQWVTFRFTPLGEFVFHHRTEAPAEAVGQIIIQPNFQVLAMGPVKLSDLAQIDLFAQRLQVDRGAFQYQLTRESVYLAQQAGFVVDDVVRYLETAVPHELPQNIRRSLSEWGAHHERIVFHRNTTLLQAATPQLLASLRQQAPTSKYLINSDVDTAVARINPHQQAKLIQALQSQGIFPAVSGASPQSADKSIIISQDGRIQPIHAVPSLYLNGRLARFSQQTADGWQLTAASISRAGGNKKKVQIILSELEKLHRGPLPPTLTQQIKAWGNYYGNATIATYTLIEFISQDILSELLKHPQLKELLYPFPAGDRAITAVPANQLPQIKAILAQLGIKITQP